MIESTSVGSGVVLDASALLCLFNNEPGAVTVAKHLDNAVIGSVNLAEVWAKWSDDGQVPPERIAATLNELALKVVDFDAEQARISGLLRPLTRAQGLSLGDRACLALASVLKLPVITTDRAWAKLDVGVRVLLAR